MFVVLCFLYTFIFYLRLCHDILHFIQWLLVRYLYFNRYRFEGVDGPWDIVQDSSLWLYGHLRVLVFVISSSFTVWLQFYASACFYSYCVDLRYLRFINVMNLIVISLVTCKCIAVHLFVKLYDDWYDIHNHLHTFILTLLNVMCKITKFITLFLGSPLCILSSRYLSHFLWCYLVFTFMVKGETASIFLDKRNLNIPHNLTQLYRVYRTKELRLSPIMEKFLLEDRVSIVQNKNLTSRALRKLVSRLGNVWAKEKEMLVHSNVHNGSLFYFSGERLIVFDAEFRRRKMPSLVSNCFGRTLDVFTMFTGRAYYPCVSYSQHDCNLPEFCSAKDIVVLNRYGFSICMSKLISDNATYDYSLLGVTNPLVSASSYNFTYVCNLTDMAVRMVPTGLLGMLAANESVFVRNYGSLYFSDYGHTSYYDLVDRALPFAFTVNHFPYVCNTTLLRTAEIIAGVNVFKSFGECHERAYYNQTHSYCVYQKSGRYCPLDFVSNSSSSYPVREKTIPLSVRKRAGRDVRSLLRIPDVRDCLNCTCFRSVVDKFYWRVHILVHNVTRFTSDRASQLVNQTIVSVHRYFGKRIYTAAEDLSNSLIQAFNDTAYKLVDYTIKSMIGDEYFASDDYRLRGLGSWIADALSTLLEPFWNTFQSILIQFLLTIEEFLRKFIDAVNEKFFEYFDIMLDIIGLILGWFLRLILHIEKTIMLSEFLLLMLIFSRLGFKFKFALIILVFSVLFIGYKRYYRSILLMFLNPQFRNLTCLAGLDSAGAYYPFVSDPIYKLDVYNRYFNITIGEDQFSIPIYTDTWDCYNFTLSNKVVNVTFLCYKLLDTEDFMVDIDGLY